MTKLELAEKVSISAGISKAKAKEAIEAAFAEVGEALANGGSYTHTGFGSFSAQTHAEHAGRHPRTGEAITIPATCRVKFSMGKALRERLNSH